MLHAEDIDAVFPADIQLANAVALPAFRHGDLDDGVVFIQLYVVEDVVGGIANGCPFCQLLFRVSHCVRAVTQQEFRLHIPLGPGHHIFCAQLLEQRCCFQRVLKAPADGNIADIIVADTQRAQKIHPGAVADLRVGDKGHTLVDPLLIPVHRHYLVSQPAQLHSQMPPEAAKSDQ